MLRLLAAEPKQRGPIDRSLEIHSSLNGWVSQAKEGDITEHMCRTQYFVGALNFKKYQKHVYAWSMKRWIHQCPSPQMPVSLRLSNSEGNAPWRRKCTAVMIDYFSGLFSRKRKRMYHKEIAEQRGTADYASHGGTWHTCLLYKPARYTPKKTLKCKAPALHVERYCDNHAGQTWIIFHVLQSFP
jgi:hypothetical protein